MPKGLSGAGHAKAPEVGPGTARASARGAFSPRRRARRSARNHASTAPNVIAASSRGHAGDEAVPAGFGERAHERLREIPRHEQREPLPRAPVAARDARQQHEQRQRLHREPAAAGQRRQHHFPQEFEQRERDQSRDRDARGARDGDGAGYPTAMNS